MALIKLNIIRVLSRVAKLWVEFRYDRRGYDHSKTFLSVNISIYLPECLFIICDIYNKYITSNIKL